MSFCNIFDNSYIMNNRKIDIQLDFRLLFVLQSPNREIKYLQNVIFFSNRKIKYPRYLIPLR